MKNKGLVTIILPVYNCERYLKESLHSIINQTYNMMEIIVINDGSTDSTERIISDFLSDDRIIFINRENRGLVYSLNEGIKLAKGEYIARMDADDIAEINRIELQVAFLEKNPDVSILGTRVNLINESGNHVGVCHRPVSHSKIMTYFIYGSPIAHPSVVFNMKNIRKEDLYYSDNAYPAEDLELWLRLSNSYNFCNMKERLLKYRLNSIGVSNSNKNKQIEKSTIIRKSHFSYDGDIVNFIDLIDKNKCTSIMSLLRVLCSVFTKKNIDKLYLINVLMRIINRWIKIKKSLVN